MLQSQQAKERVVEVVAKAVGGRVADGDDRADAYVTLDSKRVGLDIAFTRGAPADARPPASVRFRDDRVARHVIAMIEDAVAPHVPVGNALLFTLGAPIKVPSTCVRDLAALLTAYVKSGDVETEQHAIVLDNRVRYGIAGDAAISSRRVCGFVFSGDPAPRTLAHAMHELAEAVALTAARRHRHRFDGERWLIIDEEQPFADAKTYRRLYSILSPKHDYDSILMLLARKRIERLTDA